MKYLKKYLPFFEASGYRPGRQKGERTNTASAPKRPNTGNATGRAIFH